MIDAEQMQRWVEQFADGAIQQTEALRQKDSWTGNKHAKRRIAAANELWALGDRGRDALASLLTHARADVRVLAAAWLLRHRTREALEVLRKEAMGEGLAAFGASQAIKRWEEGDWDLDREENKGLGASAEETGRQSNAISIVGRAESTEEEPTTRNAEESCSRAARDYFGPRPGVGDRQRA